LASYKFASIGSRAQIVNSDDVHEYVSKVAVARDLLTQHRRAEAEPVVRQLLAIAERIWGAESPQMLKALVLLAPCLSPEERLDLWERMLRITEAGWDAEDVNIINALHHQGLALQ
jgi:hypothetical protein